MKAVNLKITFLPVSLSLPLSLSVKVQGVVTARNLALPYMFQMAEWLENFHPRTALKMRLFRLFLLYLSSLYVLIISLFSLSSQCVSHSPPL